MKVIWFTGRSINDLCSTTQASLASGLIERGHSVSFVNPDLRGSHETMPWSHYGLPVRSITGLKSISLSLKMQKWVKQFTPKKNTVALLDWRIAWKLIPLLEKKRIPWILIDRSPPADGNFLSKFQWLFWKRSWKMVKKYTNRFGCVVSKAHLSYVVRKIGVDENTISILPAGVDTNVFYTAEKTATLRLNYHGRIDTNRNITSLIEIFLRLKEIGKDVELNLHGDGSFVKKIKSLKFEGVNYTDNLNRKMLAKKLSTYDVGFLPMPDTEVWRLSSPLKRSEYFASGMIVCGINHEGHQVEDSGEWLRLFDEEEFIEGSVNWLKELKLKDIRGLQTEARIFAERNLGWEHSIEILDQLIGKVSS